MLDFIFKQKYRRNLQISFDQSSLNLSKHNRAYNKQLFSVDNKYLKEKFSICRNRIKDVKLINEGACIAYVFLFLNEINYQIGNSCDTRFSFEKFQFELKVDKNYSFLYYWMGKQREFVEDFNEALTSRYFDIDTFMPKIKRKKFKTINTIDGPTNKSSYVFLSLFLSSRNYSLLQNNLYWEYKGTLSNIDAIKKPRIEFKNESKYEIQMHIERQMKENINLQNLTMFLSITLQFKDPLDCFEFNRVYGHAMCFSFHQLGDNLKIVFFDPNKGVFEFKELTTFYDFFDDLINKTYSTECLDIDCFNLSLKNDE